MRQSSMVPALVLVCVLTAAVFVPLAGAKSPPWGIASGVAGAGLARDNGTGPISTVKQLAPILVGPLTPYQAAYDASNKLVYVTDANSPYFTNLEGVTAINGTNWANTFPVCTGTYNGPEYIAYDSANNELYVSCTYPGNVAVVNPKTDSVVTTVTAGSGPGVVAYDPANQDIYVSNYDSNTVSVISGVTNDVVATISSGDQPTFITYNPTNKDVYVIDSTYPYGITVINGVTNVFITTIQVTAGNAVYDPANQDVYATVMSLGNAYVYAISTSNQIVAKVAISGTGFPATEFGGSLAYDSGNGNVFVGSDPGTTAPNVVSEISSSNNKVIGSVNIPADCTNNGCYDLSYLTYDSKNQDIYVSGPGQFVYVVSGSVSLSQIIPLTVITSSVASNFPTLSIFDPANSEVFVLCSNYAYLIIPLSS